MNPIVGILSEWQGEERADRPFGRQTPLFEAIMTAAADQQAHVYVIPPQTIVKSDPKALLRAYTFQDDQWIETTAPYPSVVYNRMPSRRAELAAEYRQLQRVLNAHTNGRIFNRNGFFSKFHIYSVLRKKLPKGLLLPFTQAVTTPEQVIRMAHKWGKVWLKPDDGSLGRGICRIIKEPYGFTLESSDDGSTEHVQETEARSRLADLLHSRDSYIIQQEIDLATSMGRPFDLRVLLHKDESNTFKVTYQFARIAEHGQITSNVTAGGDPVALNKLLNQQEIKQLKTFALATANRLAATLPGPVGELGLDLAIDQQRRFWLLEANSKPFLKMNPADLSTQRIAACLVAYAKYLLEHPPQKKISPPKKPTPLRSRKLFLRGSTSR